MSFGDYVTSQAVTRGYAGRVLQVVQEIARYPNGCFEYAKTIAASLPLGRQGKPAHIQTVYRVFREHPELFERKRLAPGTKPPGGKHRLPYGGGLTTVRLDFLGLKKPSTTHTPRRGYNVNRQSVDTTTPRRRVAVEQLAPVELERLLAGFKAALDPPRQREFDPDLVVRPGGTDPPE